MTRLFSTTLNKKRVAGIVLLAIIVGLFFALNRFPKLDAVGGDLDAVGSATEQCFQGFCIEREAGTGLLEHWWRFSVTYLRLVAIGMGFAFLNQSQGGNYILERWQRHGRCKHQCVGSGL